MRILKDFLSAFYALCLLLVLFNIVDAHVGKRSILAQLTPLTLITAPLNAIVHFGTPSWLQEKLLKSPILKPSIDIFPSVKKLRDAIPMIKEEALQAFKQSKPIKNDLYFRGIADSGWKRFYIKWYGPIDPLAKMVCPRISALLDSMPEVHLGMFSILMPGSKIPRHFGPARMCLRYHLGLFTPNDDLCSMRVGSKTYSWRDEEDVIFDDTIQHEVVNNSTKPRIILFLDIQRPQIPIIKPITQAMISNLGPITTRTNDAREKVMND